MKAVILIINVFVVVNCVLAQHQTMKECEDVQKVFVQQKIGPASLVPDIKIHDSDMEVCYKGDKESTRQSCCSRRMERKYIQAVEKDFSHVLRSSSSYLKQLLSSNSAQYQEEFLTMLQETQNHTEAMFNEMYKIPFKDQRSAITNLFLDLQAYIKRREVNIHDSVEQFFDELFPVVFHNILNDPNAMDLDEDYKECLTEVRQDLNPKPFGDIPQKVAHQLSKSFTAARTLIEAIGLGIETINTTEHLTLDLPCVKALTRMTYCSHCEGHVNVRPCGNLCFNVMRGCLVSVADIDSQWGDFIDALEDLTKNMKGYYNIEVVLNSLHSRISEAILHAMETGHKFYAKVVSKCGHPKVKEKEQRSSPSQHFELKKLGQSKPLHKQQLYPKIELFMQSLKASKGFYLNLADLMCDEAEKFSPSLNMEDQFCWNGESIGRYNKSLVPKDLDSQIDNNPEMKVTRGRNNAMITLKDKLTHVKKLLQSKVSSDKVQSDIWYSTHRDQGSGYAHGGVDDEDYNIEFSGSGSGGGGYRTGPDYSIKNPSRGGYGNYPDEDDIYIDDQSTHSSKSNLNKGEGHNAGQRTSLHQLLGILYIGITCFTLWLNG